MVALAVLKGIGVGLKGVATGLYYGAKLAIGTAKLAWKGAKVLAKGLHKVGKTGRKLYKRVAKKIAQGATLSSIATSGQGSYIFNKPSMPTKVKATTVKAVATKAGVRAPIVETIGNKLFNDKVRKPAQSKKPKPNALPEVKPAKSHVFTKEDE